MSILPHVFAGEKINSRGKGRKEYRRRKRWIICKRPVHPDDHLQEASPSRLSFARGRSIRIIFCKRPVHSDYVYRWSVSIVGRCLSLLVVDRCLSLVVVCCWSLFFVGRCLSLVVVRRWSLFVVGH